MGEKYEFPTIVDRALVVKVTGSAGNFLAGKKSLIASLSERWRHPSAIYRKFPELKDFRDNHCWDPKLGKDLF